MANTSADGGYLVPTSPPPAADIALDKLLQQVMAGVTGLPANMVRPRTQPNDPITGKPVTTIPGADKDWCAVEVTDFDPDAMPAQIHVPDGVGYTILRRSARLSVLASFYGPNSDYYANLAADALCVPQNREAMRGQGLAFLSSDTVRRVPDIVNNSNRRRSDLPMRFVQAVERRYEIRNVASLAGGIRAAGGSDAGPVVLTNPLSTVPPSGA